MYCQRGIYRIHLLCKHDCKKSLARRGFERESMGGRASKNLCDRDTKIIAESAGLVNPLKLVFRYFSQALAS